MNEDKAKKLKLPGLIKSQLEVREKLVKYQRDVLSMVITPNMERELILLSELVTPYYDLNDEGHRINHVEQVFVNGLNIINKLKLNIDKRLFMYVSYMHDVAISLGRATHELTSANMILNDTFGIFKHFTRNERFEMYCAVCEHRASYTGEYTTDLSELISAADRCLPDLESYILRVFISNAGEYETLDDVPDNIYVAAITHLKDKYGINGYARYNNMYTQTYGDELNELKRSVTDLTLNQFREVINKKYATLEDESKPEFKTLDEMVKVLETKIATIRVYNAVRNNNPKEFIIRITEADFKRELGGQHVSMNLMLKFIHTLKTCDIHAVMDDDDVLIKVKPLMFNTSSISVKELKPLDNFSLKRREYIKRVL